MQADSPHPSSSSTGRDPLPAARPARGLQPASRIPRLGAPSFPFPPRPPLRPLRPQPGRRRAAAAAAPTCRGPVLPAAARRPFKVKPLSAPPPGPPRSACGRPAPPCPAPHRNESGRAARPAPPRRAASRPPRLRGRQRLQRLPRRGWCNGAEGRGPDKPEHGFTSLTRQPSHWAGGRRRPPLLPRGGAGRGGPEGGVAAAAAAAAGGWRISRRDLAGFSALRLSGC